MTPQEDQNIEKMYREFENMRKKVKTNTEDSKHGQELFPERQKNQLRDFLSGLSSYPKITAVMIEHQHKSIQTLPKSILQKFTQLRQRVEKSIGCCKKNASLLDKIKQTLQNNLKISESADQSKKSETHVCGGQEHSHTHGSVPPKKILGIFSHLCREYSEQKIHKDQRYFMQFINEQIKAYLQQAKQRSQNLTTLVIGSGMGRVLIEIRDIFKSINLSTSSSFIQGHEEDPELYLLSEYMLNYHDKNEQSIEIFPYVHNFSNHLKAETPYMQVKIPLLNGQARLFPLTFGSFHQLYKSHSEQWTVIVTTFYNYSVKDVLMYIQLIYKLLKKGGLWIDVATASFESHMIPYLSYEEYEKILDKSQFNLIKKESKDQLWYQEPDKLMHEWRKVHYRVMKKASD